MYLSVDDAGAIIVPNYPNVLWVLPKHSNRATETFSKNRGSIGNHGAVFCAIYSDGWSTDWRAELPHWEGDAIFLYNRIITQCNLVAEIISVFVTNTRTGYSLYNSPNVKQPSDSFFRMARELQHRGLTPKRRLEGVAISMRKSARYGDFCPKSQALHL